MTVSSTNTKNSYSGDGSTVVFAYTFKVFDDDDIQVILRNDTTGAETVQTKTTHYTVSGVGNTGGGNITFVAAPATGETVVLIRAIPLTQTTDYTPNDPFPAETHEEALDRLTFIVQDIEEEVGRSIKVSRTNTITSSEFTVGATTRANKIFAFDSDGDLAVTQEIGTYQGTDATTTTSAYAERDIIKSTTAGQLNNVYICVADSVAGDLLTDTDHFELLVDAVSAATSATAAASSATAAAASETAASASESAAATSESNAATSESNASTSETNAATSATNAATSATNAATSETNAGTSATAAASSATAAAASATAAAASESAAATSETNAATSETNAATSATTATTKASEAATSATNAATSESNASTSETNAATSATASASSATAAAASQTAAAASAASAASAFDNFDDTYLGSFSSNPTVDNDGDALVEGALYFNTTANEMRVYDGANWIAATSAGNVSLILYEYTATAGQTTFSGSDDNSATLSYTADNLQVVMNGIVLDPSDFTATNGTSVVLASGAAANDLVNIYAFKSFTVADTVSASAGGTFSGNVTVNARLDVDNIRIDGNTISSTDTNGDITLDPNGTGDTIIASGNFGVGTTSPGGLAEFYKAGTSEVLIGSDNGGTAQLSLYENDDGTKEGFLKYDGTNNRIHLATSGDANALVMPRDTGYVGLGTTDFTTQNGSVSRLLKLGGANNTVIAAEQTGSGKNFILEARNEGRSGGDRYAQMSFAEDGSDNGAIIFYTAASGSDVSERMRIDSSGQIFFGTTDASMYNNSGAGNGGVTINAANGFSKGLIACARDNAQPLEVNRLASDGTLVSFSQDGTQEGTISVSGSTVSYNGGHLSRWSQATDGNRIDGLVKGTVMTNLDQMAEWTKDGVTEDNEQLNCMAVSSVEGDANVAGVFVNWDDDDEDFTADMNIAMTGDMVIRIAQGTTVARGDLLMSTGDGTAKPQGDDIVRSKTIAKVTSTTVSHTYDDGSYLVPCVLMAC